MIEVRSYRTVATDRRLAGPPELRTRFRWRAERLARRLNLVRIFPSYRYEVVREDGRWIVVAMQSIAVKESAGR